MALRDLEESCSVIHNTVKENSSAKQQITVKLLTMPPLNKLHVMPPLNKLHVMPPLITMLNSKLRTTPLWLDTRLITDGSPNSKHKPMLMPMLNITL
jgi:hypothetical protein